MKIKFKHQKFQTDAASAVCDVFAGQPNISSTYIIDKGIVNNLGQMTIVDETDFTGFNNRRVILSDDIVKNNLNRIQRQNQIKPSKKLEGKYNLTIEMETGVGKTYTYIKTMFELNKRYGWSKFIIVVPSVAIREGVFKSFELTCDHFSEEYNKKIRYFIYNSKDLTKIDKFANDSGINVIIINSQAFNARGKDARRIYMKLDSFRSRRPIDVIAATNPILVIDEPQSVEGTATKERLKDFKPLATLRYSATHRKDSIYNMVYRLDALEAYNKKLVKKIAVKGISVNGTTATESYLYLEHINLSGDKPPTARLEFEVRGVNGIRKVSRIVREGYNLYEQSGDLDQYKGFVVSKINGLTNTIEFTNGIILRSGEVIGFANEKQIRRIQIRETIKSHLECERQLFYNGIKVLSLFFIDEVAKYKQYENGIASNGDYADIFEEEYKAAFNECQIAIGEEDYFQYLNKISIEKTHAGYFSIDKKSSNFKNSKINNRKENTSDDADAYDLIMKDKERLLDLKEPVRFIFSHSALREGWDNPNVFQICTLKQSSSDVRKRQEVGRGLRLCVDSNGERMDTNVLDSDVHNVNVLTVIASESYDSFAKELQSEIAEIIAYRPREVTADLFENNTIRDVNGLNEQLIDHKLANKITHDFIRNGYIDDNNVLTERYHDDVMAGKLIVSEEIEPYKANIINILDKVYDPQAMTPEDSRTNNVELRVDESKMQMKEFKELWSRINSRSAYVVDFNTDELIKKSIDALNRELRVSQIFYKVEQGEMEKIQSKEQLEKGEAFNKKKGDFGKFDSEISTNIKYDLIGKIVEITGLTRNTVAVILKKIDRFTFEQFHRNPEEFIIKTANIINEQKATVIIEHITYNMLDETYSLTDLFTQPSLKGRLGVNAMQVNKHLYDHVVYDHKVEKNFVSELDKSDKVAVYVKLPGGFYIDTPVGKYNPDWAIAFYKGMVKHIYFVAETKGDLSSMQLRKIEELKIHCAREHFKKISSEPVRYEVVDSYDSLLKEVLK